MPYDGVAEQVTVRGPRATGPATLLIEVPHGADTAAHYNALAARLVGPLPARLDRFFHVNTDVGAWDLALRIAAHHVDAHPAAVVHCIRCAIPRTFIDTNRVLDGAPARGLTPGLPPYIRDPADQALLTDFHRRYTDLVRDALDAVCGAGGLAVIPHTYAPRTVPIERVDDHIVEALERVWHPDVVDQSPLRPPFDLITTTPDGRDLSPPGMAERLIAALAAIDVEAMSDQSYNLHPSTAGAAWAARYPGQVLTFEVRRDLITEWAPFVPKVYRPAAIDRIAAAVAACLPG
jgi:hypothetical protein